MRILDFMPLLAVVAMQGGHAETLAACVSNLPKDRACVCKLDASSPPGYRRDCTGSYAAEDPLDRAKAEGHDGRSSPKVERAEGKADAKAAAKAEHDASRSKGDMVKASAKANDEKSAVQEEKAAKMK